MNQYQPPIPDKDVKLEVEPHSGNQLQGFMIDARALMQTKHDSTIVFLTRLFASWEFQLYYIVSACVALAAIIVTFLLEGMC